MSEATRIPHKTLLCEKECADCIIIRAYTRDVFNKRDYDDPDSDFFVRGQIDTVDTRTWNVTKRVVYEATHRDPMIAQRALNTRLQEHCGCGLPPKEAVVQDDVKPLWYERLTKEDE